MAPHSSTFAWKIPWTEEPGGLQSMGSLESDTTEWLPFHALEKEMATHSSVLAWRIPGMGEPSGLPSMGLHRVGHDWSDLAADLLKLTCFSHWGDLSLGRFIYFTHHVRRHRMHGVIYLQFFTKALSKSSLFVSWTFRKRNDTCILCRNLSQTQE